MLNRILTLTFNGSSSLPGVCILITFKKQTMSVVNLYCGRTRKTLADNTDLTQFKTTKEKDF